MQITKKQKGIILMILSALSFAAMQVVVRLASRIPTMEQIFVRNLFSLLVAYYSVKKNKVSVFGAREYQPWLFARSFFGFLGLITLFYASSNASQGAVTILNKMSPMIITISAVIFLKEKLTKIQVPALIIAFIGAILVIKPSFDTNVIPLLSAFLSAVSSSIAYTLLGYFKDKVDGMTVIMHFSTFSTIAAIPFMINNFIVPNMTELILLLLIGIFGSLGQIFITYSYRMAPASEVSIFNYSGILFSMLLGYIILNEKISTNALLGGICVIFASLLVYFYDDKLKQRGEIQ